MNMTQTLFDFSIRTKTVLREKKMAELLENYDWGLWYHDRMVRIQNELIFSRSPLHIGPATGLYKETNYTGKPG